MRYAKSANASYDLRSSLYTRHNNHSGEQNQNYQSWIFIISSFTHLARTKGKTETSAGSFLNHNVTP